VLRVGEIIMLKNFAQKAVTFSVAVSPGSVEKIAAQLHRQL
jgi:hypothetical protein